MRNWIKDRQELGVMIAVIVMALALAAAFGESLQHTINVVK